MAAGVYYVMFIIQVAGSGEGRQLSRRMCGRSIDNCNNSDKDLAGRAVRTACQRFGLEMVSPLNRQ